MLHLCCGIQRGFFDDQPFSIKGAEMKSIIALLMLLAMYVWGLNFALSAMTINRAIQNQSEAIRMTDEGIRGCE